MSSCYINILLNSAFKLSPLSFFQRGSFWGKATMENCFDMFALQQPFRQPRERNNWGDEWNHFLDLRRTGAERWWRCCGGEGRSFLALCKNIPLPFCCFSVMGFVGAALSLLRDAIRRQKSSRKIRWFSPFNFSFIHFIDVFFFACCRKTFGFLLVLVRLYKFGIIAWWSSPRTHNCQPLNTSQPPKDFFIYWISPCSFRFEFTHS